MTNDIEINSLFDAPNHTGTPERRLLLAVLERAILDYVGNEKVEIAEATEWIFAPITPGPAKSFSFTWVCQQLDLDPVKIAGKIRAMPKRGASRIAPWYTSKAYAQAKANKIERLRQAASA